MRAVNILRRWLAPALVFMHSGRLEALWKAVEAVTLGGVLSLTAMGRASRRPAKPKHRIKAMDRLLGNVRLHKEITRVYGGIAALLIRGGPTVILVDWTQVGAKDWALTAAVPVSGRALPLYSEVHPERRLGNAAVQNRFLAKLATVLPAGCRPILVTDAGFTTMWFDTVVRRGWDFVGRVRGNRRVRKAGTHRWISNKTLHPMATARARDLGIFDLSRMFPRPRRLILVRELRKRRKRIGRRGQPGRNGIDKKYAQGAREPWLLTTSLASTPKQVVSLYRSRMRIEELFRDTKNHRFGWSLGDVVAHRPERLDVLLLVAALGIIAMTFLGLAAENAGVHLHFQANTVHTRRVLSLFVLGTLVAADTLYRPTAKASAEALQRLRLQPTVEAAIT